MSFCIFYFGHCVVCSSSICGFWLPICYLQTLPTPSFQWPVRDSRISCLFNALLICVFICVLFLLNIVLYVDFRLMINTVVSSNMFSYEYLLQCCVIYFVILFILLKTNANVIIGNLTWIFPMIFNNILPTLHQKILICRPFLGIIKLCRKPWCKLRICKRWRVVIFHKINHILSNSLGVFPIVPEPFRFKTGNGIHTPNNRNTKLCFIKQLR